MSLSSIVSHNANPALKGYRDLTGDGRILLVFNDHLCPITPKYRAEIVLEYNAADAEPWLRITKNRYGKDDIFAYLRDLGFEVSKSILHLDDFGIGHIKYSEAMLMALVMYSPSEEEIS